MARRIDPFECEILDLGPRGVGLGESPDGRRVEVRGAPPGSRVAVVPNGRKNGAILARRASMVRPPPGAVTPRCAQFGLCGGCVLQELALDAQRAAKLALGVREVAAAYGPLTETTVHAVRGAPDAYGYRNKIELTFGSRRYLSEEDHAAGLPQQGRFLGFHAPGRFDRVVDAPRCELASEPMNAALAAIRAVTLAGSSLPPYEPHDHTGFWRHLALREGADGVIAVVYTSSAYTSDAVEPLFDLVGGVLAGLQWRVNDDVADVARGALRRTAGVPVARELLGPVELQLSPTAFFQVNTAGTRVLYDTIREALGTTNGGTLLDLYCGVGSIGLYIADQFDRILGIEENEASVADARINAARNGVEAEYIAGRAEDLLTFWSTQRDVHVVVDPPRAGLHPKVTKALAAGQWGSLVYVACHAASLGRDAALLRAGGWILAELWTVDLFPQTGHLEQVARFVRAETQ